MAKGQRQASPGESFADRYPEALVEWDWEKNAAQGNDPYQLLPMSTRKVFWKCERGHETCTPLLTRSTGHGCGTCARRAKPGTDLQHCYPEIAKEYSSKNEIPVDEIASKSGRRVTWECGAHGHEYELPVNKRTVRGTGCPVCAGRALRQGFNDLATVAPEAAKHWLEDENGLPASGVLGGNSKKLFAWRCVQGHTHKARIYEMKANPDRCNVCAGAVVVKGVNDLESQRPDLMAEWDPDNTIRPDEITPGSGRLVKWVCRKCQYKYQSCPADRKKYGCAACAGMVLVPGVNDLQTMQPELAAQMSPKNDKGPTEVTQFTNYRALWLCSDNSEHEWEAPVTGRAFSGSGCPHCPRPGSTSKVESRLRSVLTAYLFDLGSVVATEASLRDVPTTRRDYSRVDILAVLSDGRKLVVEYDGAYWHSDKSEMDAAKTRSLLDAGYLVVRVREAKLPALDLEDPNLLQICGVEPYYGNKRGTELARVLTDVCDFLGIPVGQEDFGLAV